MRTALLCLFVAAGLRAQVTEDSRLRFYGSLGNEAHLTPNNPESPLNPGGVLGIRTLTNSSDFTLFGDINSETKRWKFHFKLRGSSELNSDSTARGSVNEAYWNISITPWLDFFAGRKIEKWGTGYGWNPTGVVNPPKDPRDPNDRRDTYRGVDEIGVDLFLKNWNVSLHGVPVIRWSGQGDRRLLGTGWAARAYRLIKGVDLSLTASGGSGLPNSQGLSVSRVFGKALELHAEAAMFQNTIRYVPASNSFELERRNHAEVLVGGQYTFPHFVNVTLEYYHNGGGLSSSQWLNFERYAQLGASDLAIGNPATLTNANRQFDLMNMGRDYLFQRYAWPIRLNKLEFETIVISNLRDGSTAIRPGIYWKVRPNWLLYWIQTEFIGSPHTEFGNVQIRRSSDFGFRYHF